MVVHDGYGKSAIFFKLILIKTVRGICYLSRTHKSPVVPSSSPSSSQMGFITPTQSDDGYNEVNLCFWPRIVVPAWRWL